MVCILETLLLEYRRIKKHCAKKAQLQKLYASMQRDTEVAYCLNVFEPLSQPKGHATLPFSYRRGQCFKVTPESECIFFE